MRKLFRIVTVLALFTGIAAFHTGCSEKAKEERAKKEEEKAKKAEEELDKKVQDKANQILK